MSIGGNILVIDDEATLRHTLARILQQQGFTVTTAENGEQGLSLLEQNTYDLVFMDLRMPGITGLDVLEKIRATHFSLPVILFTAQPDLNSAVEALRRGATDYLLKPLKPEVILEKAEKILIAKRYERRKKEIIEQIAALQEELKSLEAGIFPPPTPATTPADTSERYLTRGPVTLDLHAHKVLTQGKSVNLPPTSCEYLRVLMRHSPNVVNYQTLVSEAQGYIADPREAQELAKWHIHHIRQAIEPDTQEPAFVLNVRGVGYRFVTQ